MGGFGVSQSSSQSQQRSGLSGTAGEGTAVQQSVKQGMNLSNLSNQLVSSPGAMMNMGRQMLDTGKYGLGSNVDQGVEALGKYQFGEQSGIGAGRGQVTPENLSGVIGSSVQNMLPFLIPQMQQHQYAQFQAPQSLMQTAKTSADYWSRALGGQGSASSDSFGFNANVGGAAKPFQG